MERIIDWLRSVEQAMDERGSGWWILAMIVGFIFFWPIGLFLLGYIMWNGKMSCSRKKQRGAKANYQWRAGRYSPSSGNMAFDEYREETLRRLEDEQKDFADFMEKLRKAKDKAEFEQFMKDRKSAAQRGPGSDEEGGAHEDSENDAFAKTPASARKDEGKDLGGAGLQPAT